MCRGYTAGARLSAAFYGAGLGLGQVVGMATDGVPTLLAATDQPAIRHLRPGDLHTGPPPGTPRFADP